MKNFKRWNIANYITEDVNTPGDGTLDPGQFISAVNGIIAAAPHGQQGAALQRVIEIGMQDRFRLISMLEQIEPVHDSAYIQDFFKTKASNIMLVSRLAGLLYTDDVVLQILDKIDLATEYSDPNDEEDDLYNSEGDGYSH
jgi:hypothetical protein